MHLMAHRIVGTPKSHLYAIFRDSKNVAAELQKYLQEVLEFPPTEVILDIREKERKW